MTLISQLQLLQRLDAFIKRKSTGTPDELAFKLGISKRSVFNYLDKLRDYGAEVNYCNFRCTYYYFEDRHPKFPILFSSESSYIKGGIKPFLSLYL